MEHIPVLRENVQKYLNLKSGEVVVDATLGLAGHALDILKSVGENGVLYAFDTDERNLEEAKKRLKGYQKQIIFIHDNFRSLKTRITTKIDAILFDLGLSSPHIDDAERGFSFMKDGPLDMRFDSRNSLTAANVLNTYCESDLAEIFFRYGEERMSRKVAKRICERRKQKKFERTLELAAFLEGILPKKYSKKVHPATKIFQALRIEVNDELGALKEALEGAFEVLKIGGRIVVISYHSLEDRITKKFFQELEHPVADPEKSVYQVHDDPFVEKLTKKPVIPTEEEINENPRSRSAKLRAYRKLRSLK